MSMTEGHIGEIARRELGHDGGSDFFRRTVDRAYWIGLADPTDSMSRSFQARTRELGRQFAELEELKRLLQQAEQAKSSILRKRTFESIGTRPVESLTFLSRLKAWASIEEARKPLRFFWDNFGSASEAIRAGELFFRPAVEKLGLDSELPWVLLRDIAAHAVRADRYGLAQARLNEALRIFQEQRGPQASAGRALSHILNGEVILESQVERISAKARFERALKEFQVALELAQAAEPTTVRPLSARADVRIARIYAQRGETEKALDQLTGLVDQAYADQNKQLLYDGLLQRGELLLNLGSLPQAQADLERARLISYGRSLFEYGTACLLLSRTFEPHGGREELQRWAGLLLAIELARDAVDAFARTASPRRSQEANDLYARLCSGAPTDIMAMVDDPAVMQSVYPLADQGAMAVTIDDLAQDSEGSPLPSSDS